MKTGLTTLPLVIQKCHKLRVGRIARNGSALSEGVIAAAKRAIISTT